MQNCPVSWALVWGSGGVSASLASAGWAPGWWGDTGQFSSLLCPSASQHSSPLWLLLQVRLGHHSIVLKWSTWASTSLITPLPLGNHLKGRYASRAHQHQCSQVWCRWPQVSSQHAGKTTEVGQSPTGEISWGWQQHGSEGKWREGLATAWLWSSSSMQFWCWCGYE